ncbi:MAG: nuclear transport factor 2 family protein [Polyangiaceae bacterium]
MSPSTAEQNRALITTFYECFQKKDSAGMVACYADDVSFTDPVFQTLHGPKAGAMWKMLIGSGSDLRLEFKDVKADEKRGSAHWDAYYTFSGTGRFVHNSIDAAFEFRDGKIVKHVDTFDLHRWAGQALGLMGKLFGGFGFLQSSVRAKAARRLEDYVAKTR